MQALTSVVPAIPHIGAPHHHNHQRPKFETNLEKIVKESTFGRVKNLAVVGEEKEGIIITGTSRTWYTKQLAQEAVKKAYPGLPIENKITVLSVV